MSADATLTGVCEESIYRARLIHAWKCVSHKPVQDQATGSAGDAVGSLWHESFYGLQLELAAAHHKSMALRFPLSLHDKRQLQSLYAPFHVVVRARLAPSTDRDKNPLCLAEHQRAYQQLDHVLVNDLLVKFNSVCLLDRTTIHAACDQQQPLVADDEVAVLDGNERNNAAMELDALRVAMALQHVLSDASVGRPFELLFARHNHAKAQRAIIKYAQTPAAKQAQDAQRKELLQEAQTKPMEEKRKREFQMQQMDLTLESFLFDVLGDKLVTYQESIVQSNVWQAYQVANVSWFYNARNGRLYAENPMRMLTARQMVWGATLQAQIAARKLQKRVKVVLKASKLMRQAMDHVIDSQTSEFVASVFDAFWIKDLQPFYEQIRPQLVLSNSNNVELQAMEIWERWKRFKVQPIQADPPPVALPPAAPSKPPTAAIASTSFATALVAKKMHQIGKKNEEKKKIERKQLQLNRWNATIQERTAVNKLIHQARLWQRRNHLSDKAIEVLFESVVDEAIGKGFTQLWSDEVQSFYHRVEPQLLFRTSNVEFVAMEVWERWKRRNDQPSLQAERQPNADQLPKPLKPSESKVSSSSLPTGTIQELSLPSCYEESLYRARLIHAWNFSCGSLTSPSSSSFAFSKQWHGSFFGLELQLLAARNKRLTLHFPLRAHERKQLQSFFPPFRLLVHAKLQLAFDQPGQKPACLVDHEQAYRQLEHVLVNDLLVKFNGICLLDRIEPCGVVDNAHCGDCEMETLVVSGGECRRFVPIHDAVWLVECLEEIRSDASIGHAFELLFVRHNHVQAHNAIVPFARLEATQRAQQTQQKQLLEETLKQSVEEKRLKQFELQQMDAKLECYLFQLLGTTLVTLEEQILRQAQWQAYQFANVLWYYNTANGRLYAEHPMRMLQTKQMIWGATLLVRTTVKRLQRCVRAKLELNKIVLSAIDAILESILNQAIRQAVDTLWQHQLGAFYQTVHPQLTFTKSKVELEAMELMERWRRWRQEPAAWTPTAQPRAMQLAVPGVSIAPVPTAVSVVPIKSSSPEQQRPAALPAPSVDSIPEPPRQTVAAPPLAPPSPRLPQPSITSSFAPSPAQPKQKYPVGPTYIVVEALPRTKPATEVDLTMVSSEQVEEDECQGEWNEYLRMLKRNPKLKHYKHKSPNKLHVLAVLAPNTASSKNSPKQISPTGKMLPATRIQAAYRGYKTRQQYPNSAYDEEEQLSDWELDNLRRNASAAFDSSSAPDADEFASSSSAVAKKLPYLRAAQRF